jgi:hypothetical protein
MRVVPPAHASHLYDADGGGYRLAGLDYIISDIATWPDQVTPYDEQHFIIYARLLDAEAVNADWREVARLVLLLDPDKDPEAVHRCWQAHLARAKWIATTGYLQLLNNAGLH